MQRCPSSEGRGKVVGGGAGIMASRGREDRNICEQVIG